MDKKELIEKIEALQEWETILEEAKNEVESLRDEIKADMAEKELDEMDLGQYIVRWTPILSNRFDTTAFKKAYGDLYKAYTKQVASRRFTIA